MKKFRVSVRVSQVVVSEIAASDEECATQTVEDVGVPIPAGSYGDWDIEVVGVEELSPEEGKERMDSEFSVFNLHVNDAGKRADAEFKKQFGGDKFDEVIAPLHNSGIMGIFTGKPSLHTFSWVSLVTMFVNEGREGAK